jgi:Mrp family chromosome partitioning ATPase
MQEPKNEKTVPDFTVKTNPLNRIRRTVAVLSGKGGVGKSLVASLLAVELRRRGYEVGVMDADITGPSIPKVFGAGDDRPQDSEMGIYPVRTQTGIRLMSINLLLERSDDPVIWRGPLIGGAVKQFWTDVVWGDLDFLILDMPPGTGDVALTVFQSIPLDGALIVTSPQNLVALIVRKAYRMAKTMNIPVLGVVENMSYVACPRCGEEIRLFGESRAQRAAEEMGAPLLASLPLDPALAALCDEGRIETASVAGLAGCVDAVEKIPPRNE